MQTDREIIVNPSLLFQTLDSRLYLALERPHLECGSIVLSSQLIGEMRLMENVQRRATKLKILDLHSLKYRHRRNNMILNGVV